MRRALLTKIRAAQTAGRACAVVTDLSTGLQGLFYPETQEGSVSLPPDLRDDALRMLSQERSGLIGPEDSWFIQSLTPPPRLVIVGAVHIAQALIPMARQLGYAVVVIDPREAWGDAARFPDVTVMQDWPDEAMAKIAPDMRTAVVALTHDPKLDDPALSAALASPAFFVGALGSRRTHIKRLERLRAQGVAEDDLNRIRGPVGLAIGAVTQAEIAVSILAEITQLRRQGDA